MACACDAVELAVGDVVFYGVKMGGYGVDAAWVADEDDAVGQLGWMEVKMEYGAIAVDDEF